MILNETIITNNIKARDFSFYSKEQKLYFVLQKNTCAIQRYFKVLHRTKLEEEKSMFYNVELV